MSVNESTYHGCYPGEDGKGSGEGGISVENIGNTIFFTREAAKAALKEREKDES